MLLRKLKKNRRLPNKPSALIRLALVDLAAVEKDTRYRVNMNKRWHEKEWHDKETGKRRCTICLAGAVIAQEGDGIGPEIECSPLNFRDGVTRKLFALDEFRTGEILLGLGYLGMEKPGGVPERWVVTPYELDRKLFKQDMKKWRNGLKMQVYSGEFLYGR